MNALNYYMRIRPLVTFLFNLPFHNRKTSEEGFSYRINRFHLSVHLQLESCAHRPLKPRGIIQIREILTSKRPISIGNPIFQKSKIFPNI